MPTPVRWREWREDPRIARNTGWSAAFVSWLMCEAGFSLDQFQRNSAHSLYVGYARANPDRAAHTVHDIRQIAPAAGDLLCAVLAPVLSSLDDLPMDAFHPMHCFLVTAVSGSQADIIGGHVGTRLAKIRVRLIESGVNARVVRSEGQPWLLLMKLRDQR